MFESDQHDFDDEYAELSHSAPPPPAVKQPLNPEATVKQAAVEPAVKQSTTQVATPVVKQATVPTSTARPIFSTTSLARPVVAHAEVAEPVAVAEPVVKEHEPEEPEQVEVAPGEPLEFVDPAEQQVEAPPTKKKPNLLLLGGAAFLVIFAIFVVYTATKPKDDAPPPGDMGPGIVAVSGLRGHLNTRWEGNAKTGRLEYKLSIEPMEDRWQAGFSQAVLKAPEPIYVNVRLLDATGFALCGKEIVFRFDPRNGYVPAVAAPQVGSDGKKLSAAEREAAVQTARQNEISQMQAAEVQREHGRDIFQSQLTDDGQVAAVNVQGTLPCSPDQFRQANYWDFNTNFPTLDQQADLLNPRAAGEMAREASAARRSQRRPNYRPQEGFIIQGDDRVAEYDAANGVLWAQGRKFQVDRHTGATTATAWANNNTLIHYRCDQEANCALTAAGGTAVLHATLSN